MANPISPTAITIVTEAYRRCGLSLPTNVDIQKGIDELLEEVKKQIASVRKWKMLEESVTTVLTAYQRNYSLPSDMNYEEVIRLYSGNAGISQAVSANSITLAAAEALTQVQAQGAVVFITSGAAVGSYARILSYSITTKVASTTAFSPNTPGGTPNYMVVTAETALDAVVEEQLTLFDELGIPKRYSKYEGELILSPIPNVSNLVICNWYQLRVDRVDLTGSKITEVYEKWHPALVRGIMWGIYQASANDKQESAKAEFADAVKLLVEEENRR